MPPTSPAAPIPPAAKPNRNSTTSDPSRSTARDTTVSKTASEREPAFTAPPTACISSAISRPWADIQTTCQPIMSTAESSTAALNTSCPAGQVGDEPRPPRPQERSHDTQPDAGRDEYSAPGYAPRRRTDDRDDQCRLEDLAEHQQGDARHGLLHHEPALGRVSMKIAKESVGAGVQRADEDDDAVVRQDHALTVEIRAFELLGCRVFVGHPDFELGVRRHVEFGRLVLVVLDHQGELGRVRRGGGAGTGQSGGHCGHWQRQFHDRQSRHKNYIRMIIVLITVCQFTWPGNRRLLPLPCTKS